MRCVALLLILFGSSPVLAQDRLPPAQPTPVHRVAPRADPLAAGEIALRLGIYEMRREANGWWSAGLALHLSGAVCAALGFVHATVTAAATGDLRGLSWTFNAGPGVAVGVAGSIVSGIGIIAMLVAAVYEIDIAVARSRPLITLAPSHDGGLAAVTVPW